MKFPLPFPSQPLPLMSHAAVSVGSFCPLKKMYGLNYLAGKKKKEKKNL
jgi:hypothetical protein